MIDPFALFDQLELSAVLFLASSVVGMLLMISLVIKGLRYSPNLILAALIFSNLLYQAANLLVNISGPESHPFLLRFSFPAIMLSAALLYLYVLILTSGSALHKRHWKHLIPFAVSMVWITGATLFELLFLQGSRRAEQTYFLPEALAARVVAVVTLGFYLFQSAKTLITFKKSAPDLLSDIDQVRMKWLSLMLVFFTAIWLAASFTIFTQPMAPIWQFHPVLWFVGYFCLAVAALSMAPIFGSTSVGEMESALEPEQTSSDADSKKLTSIQGQRFSDKDLAQWADKLLNYMSLNSPYLNPELRLADLSEAVGIKPYIMSEVLNRHLGTSFFSFVNTYRVEEAKRRLSDPKFDYMSIIGIASECGFNSKSSFNETFRLMVGMTPSAFRGKQKSNTLHSRPRSVSSTPPQI